MNCLMGVKKNEYIKIYRNTSKKALYRKFCREPNDRESGQGVIGAGNRTLPLPAAIHTFRTRLRLMVFINVLKMATMIFTTILKIITLKTNKIIPRMAVHKSIAPIYLLGHPHC